MKEIKTKRPKIYFMQLFGVIFMFVVFERISSEIFYLNYIISGAISGLSSYAIFLIFLKIFKKENYLIKKY